MFCLSARSSEAVVDNRDASRGATRLPRIDRCARLRRQLGGQRVVPEKDAAREEGRSDAPVRLVEMLHNLALRGVQPRVPHCARTQRHDCRAAWSDGDIDQPSDALTKAKERESLRAQPRNSRDVLSPPAALDPALPTKERQRLVGPQAPARRSRSTLPARRARPRGDAGGAPRRGESRAGRAVKACARVLRRRVEDADALGRLLVGPAVRLEVGDDALLRVASREGSARRSFGGWSSLRASGRTLRDDDQACQHACTHLIAFALVALVRSLPTSALDLIRQPPHQLERLPRCS